MSTLKTDAITAISAGGDLSLDGLGTGGVSIASTLKMTKGGDIASASPLVIDTDGNYFDVTGTTNFAAMTVESGNFFMLQFDGALTITHGSGIELPGAANLTTATGDRLMCYATAANTVEVMSVETEAAAAGGAWNVIGTAVASSSASLTITGLSDTYASYVVIGSDLLPATDDVEAWIRLGDSSGIDSGASDYDWGCYGQTANTSFASEYDDADGQINISGTTSEAIGNATGEGIGFILTLPHPATSTMRSGVMFQTTQRNSATAEGEWFVGQGNRRAVIVRDRIQFLFQSGNIASGRLTAYGVAHA